MPGDRDHAKLRLLPRGVRDELRQRQVAAIEAEVNKSYADRIRSAPTRAEKRALRARRDAEIEKRIGPLMRERAADAPRCL